MDECAVETCHRPAVVTLDRPPKKAPTEWTAKWVICRTCWRCLLGFGPYDVRAVWEGCELKRLVARRPAAEAEDERGPVLQA